MGNSLAARVARPFAKGTLGKQSWHKIPEWLTNYNWTEGQAGLTDGQASAALSSRNESYTALAGMSQRKATPSVFVSTLSRLAAPHKFQSWAIGWDGLRRSPASSRPGTMIKASDQMNHRP